MTFGEILIVIMLITLGALHWAKSRAEVREAEHRLKMVKNKLGIED